jgi:hypothetical protein
MIRHKVSREVNICAKSQSGKHDELIEIIGIYLLALLFFFITLLYDNIFLGQSNADEIIMNAIKDPTAEESKKDPKIR